MSEDGIGANIARFLDRLQSVQNELLELYESKRSALTRARASELNAIVERETVLSTQLEEILRERRRVLRAGRELGLPDGSIAELVGAFQNPAMEARVADARQRTERLRREGWVHWIIAQRAYKHCTAVIDLVAHRGERAVTYSPQPDTGGTGGAILDASA